MQHSAMHVGWQFRSSIMLAVGEWPSEGIQLCGLASRIEYEATWLVGGIPEVCSYMASAGARHEAI